MKVLVADDHWVVRESIKLVMKRLLQRLVCLEAETCDEVMATLRANPDIDLMLIDLIMPGFDEFTGVERLRKEFPDIPIVILSVHDDAEHVIRAVSCGVIGYIPKTAGGEEIEKALERVLAGEVSFPREILQKRTLPRAGSAGAAGPAQPSDKESTLTRREREILGFLGEGLSAARIAERLSVSPHTVRVHIGNMTTKLGLKDRSAMIHYAISVANAKT